MVNEQFKQATDASKLLLSATNLTRLRSKIIQDGVSDWDDLDLRPVGDRLTPMEIEAKHLSECTGHWMGSAS